MKYELASSTWDDRELSAMKAVIDSGHHTMGRNVEAFEKEFADYLGVNHTVMVNSGSSANLLSVAALFYTKSNPLQIDDEVIVPAVSWATTYHPLLQYGLKLKFVDIDLRTLNYDLDMLEGAINENTRMIVVVNLLGNPNEFSRIHSMIAGKNIFLIEDNCESLGAEYEGKKAGTFGIMGTYSTFFSHHISTMEGGLISTNDEELYHILLSLRSHGWTRHLPMVNKVTGKKSEDPFEESFKFVLPGYNLRPLELEGAVGIEQIKKLSSFILKRRENANYFKSKFKDHPYILMQEEIGQSSWFGFSIILKENSDISRKELITFLMANSIDCRPIVSGNFLINPVMKYYKYEQLGPMDNANHLHSNGFFVGNHHYSLEKEIDYLYEKIDEFINE